MPQTFRDTPIQWVPNLGENVPGIDGATISRIRRLADLAALRDWMNSAYAIPTITLAGYYTISFAPSYDLPKLNGRVKDIKGQLKLAYR